MVLLLLLLSFSLSLLVLLFLLLLMRDSIVNLVCMKAMVKEWESAIMLCLSARLSLLRSPTLCLSWVHAERGITTMVTTGADIIILVWE